MFGPIIPREEKLRMSVNCGQASHSMLGMSQAPRFGTHPQKHDHLLALGSQPTALHRVVDGQLRVMLGKDGCTWEEKEV